MKRSDARKTDLVRHRRTGRTLRQCAAAVGIHVATVCRWQVADPRFYRRMRDAERAATSQNLTRRPTRKPRVRWGSVCPRCSAIGPGPPGLKGSSEGSAAEIIRPQTGANADFTDHGGEPAPVSARRRPRASG
jgi:hypothetical protein